MKKEVFQNAYTHCICGEDLVKRHKDKTPITFKDGTIQIGQGTRKPLISLCSKECEERTKFILLTRENKLNKINRKLNEVEKMLKQERRGNDRIKR